MTSQPFTLRSAAGLPAEPQPLVDSTLIIIDAQREYVAGPLALEGVDDAVSNIVALLAVIRKEGSDSSKYSYITPELLDDVMHPEQAVRHDEC